MAGPALRANVTFPTRYRFGWGRRAELAAEARAAGVRRALVVTDPGVAALPWFDPLAAALADAVGAVVWAAVSTNPTEAEVLAGLAAFRAHAADGVIAIGGGSPIDAGRVIAMLVGLGAGAPGDVAALAVDGARARELAGARPPPLVAMPTTAGTGAELSSGAVVTDPAARVKRTVLHPVLMARAVVADPEVTVGLPAALTAATAADALTHAIEALLVPAYHPMCDAIALEAVRLIAAHLPRAIAAPDDADARGHLMMAASMAAVAFQKGLGLVHAMAHPLGAVLGVHHGLANAVLLPHVLACHGAAIAAPCARLCAALEVAPGADPVATVVAAVRGLLDRSGLPATLPAPAGGAPVAELAALALGERMYLATSPTPARPVELVAIYQAVFARP